MVSPADHLSVVPACSKGPVIGNNLPEAPAASCVASRYQASGMSWSNLPIQQITWTYVKLSCINTVSICIWLYLYISTGMAYGLYYMAWLTISKMHQNAVWPHFSLKFGVTRLLNSSFGFLMFLFLNGSSGEPGTFWYCSRARFNTFKHLQMLARACKVTGSRIHSTYPLNLMTFEHAVGIFQSWLQELIGRTGRRGEAWRSGSSASYRTFPRRDCATALESPPVCASPHVSTVKPRPQLGDSAVQLSQVDRA